MKFKIYNMVEDPRMVDAVIDAWKNDEDIDEEGCIKVRVIEDDGNIIAEKSCNNMVHARNTLAKLQRDPAYVQETIRQWGVE